MIFNLSTQTEADAIREAEEAIAQVGLYFALKQYCTLCSMCGSFIRLNTLEKQPVSYWKEYLERKLNVWEHLQKVEREQPGLYRESKKLITLHVL